MTPLSLLSLLLSSPALAGGTVVWIAGEPDPLLAPELRVVPIGDAAPAGWLTPTQADAIDRLAAELEAVRPLALEFDGEVQIMQRLQGAIEDVVILEGDEDRALLYEALAFQGFAVQRYFQDGLSSDPAAAPYRAEVLGRSEITAWVDATALDPERVPDSELISEEPELIAFDDVRARVRVAPQAALVFDDLPEGASAFVDGREIVGEKARLTAGLHRVAISRGDELIYRTSTRLAPGDEIILQIPASANMLRELAPTLAAGPEQLALSESVVLTLSELEAPVHLALETESGDRLLYAIEGRSATLALHERAGGDAAEGLGFRVGVGGGWLYDGDWFLANVDNGAPYEVSTVNAGVPVLTAGAAYRSGFLAAGVGSDVMIPLGDWHALPSGESEIRLRAHPHLSLGLPWLQLSGGFLFPWQFTFGGRAYVPLGGQIELSAVYLYGPGAGIPGDTSRYRTSVDQAAWLAIGANIGR